MKKIIIANHVMLSAHRPWQREDEDFFASALERFKHVCELAKKQKSGLVLTGSVFGRMTNPQFIEVINELPKNTFVISEKETPVLKAMHKAGFVFNVTQDSPFDTSDGIHLATGEEDDLSDALSSLNTVLFATTVAEKPKVGAVFSLTDHNVAHNEDLGLPNAIRLFPGDDNKPAVSMIKLTSQGMNLETIEMPFDDEHYLSPVTDKTNQIQNNLAMTNEGATSKFASLLKEHGDKISAGETSSTEAIVNETKSDNESLETYITDLYEQANKVCR